MNPKTMCSRLMSLGIPKTASHQLVVQIGEWEKHSGVEWTVERLKEVKLLYLHRLEGKPYTPKQWIKLKGGIPSGPLKVLFREKKNFSKALTALLSYSVYVSATVTPTQRKKFLESMESTDETGLNSRIHPVKPSVHREISRPPTLVEYCTSLKKRGPSEKGTRPEMEVEQMFLHGAMSNAVRMIVASDEDIFRRVIPTDIFFQVEPHPRSDVTKHTLGRISAIQEPGYKLRAVANPSRVLQAALEPLKRDLESVLRSFSTDFTFNQEKALPLIQGWLKQRRTVYSVDLSDATNLFPWPLQRELLQEQFTHPESRRLIEIMDQCATGPWHNTLGGDPVCHFTRGQPLGLGPSFFTFALSHNTLLQGICERRGIEPRFCVLGDDVVIADPHLHRIYRETLRNLGCKVSPSKTFKSKNFAEFAGYVILADRVGKGFKWRMISDHSFASACTNLGKSTMSLLTKEQRAVAAFLGPIPKPLGGFGWSDGRSLDQFFANSKNDALITALISRNSEVRTVMFRNLNADLLRFISNVSSFQTDSLASLLMSDESWRQLTVSDWIQIDPSLLRDGPRFAIGTLDEGRTLPQLQGYYPIVERDGDPRPSVLGILKSIADASIEQPAFMTRCSYKAADACLRDSNLFGYENVMRDAMRLQHRRAQDRMNPNSSNGPSKDGNLKKGHGEQGFSM